MIPVVGVDGCPGGWIAVRWGEAVTHQLCRSFAEVLAMDAAVIAVDMPIGFAETADEIAKGWYGPALASGSRASSPCLRARR